MAVAVELPEAMEAAVRFVEATPPARIVEETIARLGAGGAASDLLAASALAVSRSTELPADHHGGPVHPVSGVHAIHHTGSWLTGDWSKMPVVHSVALANRHVHSPGHGTGDHGEPVARLAEGLAGRAVGGLPSRDSEP